MKIELISKEQYNFLKEMYEKHPILTLQNEGYEYIDKSKFTQETQKAFDKITEILKKHITGFIKFNNFKLSKKGNQLQLRFQYNWDADNPNESGFFEGVGYLLLDELLNGFEENGKNI